MKIIKNIRTNSNHVDNIELQVSNSSNNPNNTMEQMFHHPLKRTHGLPNNNQQPNYANKSTSDHEPSQSTCTRP